MPQTFTAKDVELLGYTTAKVLRDPSTHTIINATAIAGVEEVRAHFLYLKSKCTVTDLRNVAAEIDRATKLHVVTPPSLGISDARIRDTLGNVASINTQTDLIWRRLGTAFDHYRTRLSALPVDDNFIEPRAFEPDVANDLVRRLLKFMGGQDSTDNRHLLVLSAHAGVGKTTVARHLTQQLTKRAAKYKTVPLYVEAEHWSTLDLNRVDNLWDVFSTSLRELSPELTLSESLLRHALQQGYLSFVFDGFDELCAHDSFDPADVLVELADIAAESEARILLTTRTLFWKARVPTVPDNVRVWTMDSFNVQQAKGYFRKNFGERSQRTTIALDVYHQLRAESATPPESVGSVRAQFVNLPLCVRMIADFVKDDGQRFAETRDTSVIQRFLRAICRREIARHRLVSSETRQLRALQDIAAAYHTSINPQFDIRDLFLSIDGFDEDDDGKVVDHALLARVPQESRSAETFQLRYDFLGPLLRALAIREWIVDAHSDAIPVADILQIMANEADGKGHVLEQLTNLLTLDHMALVTQRIPVIRAERAGAESFLFHLGQELSAELKTKRERTRALLFGGLPDEDGNVLDGWTFRGLVEGMDLRNVTFVNTRFVDVIFKKCVTDATTVFRRCAFEGDLRFDKGAAFAQVQLEDCREKYPADMAWARVLKRDRRDYADSVGEILRISLRKFWRNGRVRRTLRKADWKKGGLGRFGDAKRVLDAMLRAGLVTNVRISGAEEGGIAFDDASMRDLQNYMDNQQLSGRIAAVHKALLESMKR